jgi:hypothetical protein
MMNKLGKTLVLIHVTISLLALAWVTALFLQFVDWGWKQPRVDDATKEKIPSELDKRVTAVAEAVKERDRVLPSLKRSQDAWFDATDHYADNHFFYRNELERLQKYNGMAPLVVKEVKIDNGVVVLDTKSRAGKPVLDQAIADIDKSIAQYDEVLKGLNKQIDALEKESRETTEKAKIITKQLNGMDDEGKKTAVGLYDLLENEAQMQARIRFEKSYLQPQWAEALEKAQEFTERKAKLQQTLQRLRTDLSKGGKK